MQQAESIEDFVRNVAQQSWALFRKDALLYVLAALIAMILAVVTLGVLAGPMFVGFVDLVRRAGRGEPVQVDQVFAGFQRFWPSLIATLLVAVAASLGLLLLVVPGLIVIVFTTFALHVITYDDSTAVFALRRSFSIVRERFLHVLVLLILISLLQSLGSSIVLGVLLTMPLSLIATTVAYERLAPTVPHAPDAPPGVIVR